MIREVKKSLRIFFTRMSPSHFFEVGNINTRIPLDILCNGVVLCVSAIGSAKAFVQGIKKVFFPLSHLILHIICLIILSGESSHMLMEVQ
jgi:hypothetical protein